MVFGLKNSQIPALQKKFGSNSFPLEKNSLGKILWRQFSNSLNLIIIIAALLSYFLGQFIDGTLILGIVIINISLSFFQEFRSSLTAERLNKLINHQVLVIRDNQSLYLKKEELVPGDLVELKMGDIVPADLILISAHNLTVNEALLTGESSLIIKSLANHHSKQLFAGSTVNSGSGRGVVSAIGEKTKLGQIAYLSRTTKKITAYQQSLTTFSLYLVKIILISLVIILAIRLIRVGSFQESVSDLIFLIALSITVVPEALPIISTIALSRGALKLAQQKVIVKRLSSLEDLGRITLLCTDKTGTLTQDKLAVKEIITHDELLFSQLILAAVEDRQVLNRAYINSYDQAFLNYFSAEKLITINQWQNEAEIAFDPEARRRRVIVTDPKNQRSYLIVVGAPISLFPLCQNELTSQKLINQAKFLNQNGSLRQHALAYRILSAKERRSLSENFDILAAEHDLHFLGFALLEDPLRPSALAAIKNAQKFGVAVKILTGDSVAVATHVGQELGIIGVEEKVYSGEELFALTIEKRRRIINQANIFARITPSQKYDLIQEFKKKNIVGYQGDGINDAPALKLADVGIAVNNATPVAKESADIILLGKGLNTIINGILSGRRVFTNINKYMKHTIIGDLGNFFSLSVYYLFFTGSVPLLPLQLLVADLIQDFPLLAIFSDHVDEEDILLPPTNSLKEVLFISSYLGIFSAIFYFFYFFFIVRYHVNSFTYSNLFIFFNFVQLVIIFSVRKRCFFWRGQKPSWLLIISSLAAIIISLLLVYSPALATIFHFSAPPISSIIYMLIFVMIYFFALDICKYFLEKLFKRRFYLPAN